MIRRWLIWYALDCRRCPGWARPWVFGLAIGRWPRRVK